MKPKFPPALYGVCRIGFWLLSSLWLLLIIACIRSLYLGGMAGLLGYLEHISPVHTHSVGTWAIMILEYLAVALVTVSCWRIGRSRGEGER